MSDELNATDRARAVFLMVGVAPSEEDVARLALMLSGTRPRRLPALETEPYTLPVVTPWPHQ